MEWLPWLVLALVHSWSAVALDILPIVRTTKSDPYVSMPQITTAEMEKAFIYADDQKNSRTKVENDLTKNGRAISKNKYSAGARHQRFNAINPFSIKMDQVQKLFEDASRNLATNKKLTMDQRRYGLPRVKLPSYGGSARTQRALSSCQEQYNTPACNAGAYFRTADGSCNNLQFKNWGKSFTCFQRLYAPDYADGISEPRVGVNGNPLPNPRVVSTTIHPDLNVPASQYTLMTMQWGQFMDHDMTLTPMTRGTNMEMIECCPISNSFKHPACFPIELPPNDNFFAPRRQSCLNFVRSAACDADCTLGPRQQTNQLTAFIDGSQVYGSNKSEADSLRAFSNGLMKTQNSRIAGELLPESIEPENDQCSRQEGIGNCFHAGDERVNEQPGLTCMHTIWVRQHNRLARAFKQRNPYASDEQLYQLCRKIVGAQIQRITYGEFLPVVLGDAYMQNFNLYPLNSGYTAYDPNTEPTILHPFATACYRFGHTLIQNLFPEVDANYRQYGSLNLSENFFFPQSVFNNELPDIVRGLVSTPAQQFDRFVVAAVTNNLYKERGTPFGMDLVALNLQRARDHGLHGYVDYVDYCFGIRITDWSQMTKFMSSQNVQRLRNVYANVGDVELFSAGILEDFLTGAVVGPTFGCIIGIQFYHLKFGDRFYFEHGYNKETNEVHNNFFTTQQINEIRGTTLAQVLCANSAIDYIPQFVFLPGGRKVSCSSLYELNLNYFRGDL